MKPIGLEQIGEVEKRPLIEDISTNWRVSTAATDVELAAINKAVDLVRFEYPYVE